MGQIFLAKSKYGRYLYAIGGNPEASRLSGLSVGLIRSITYIFSGFTMGVAGSLAASQLSSAQAQMEPTIVFDVIAIVVLGGTSLSGGVGSVWRTAIGLAIVAAISNGFTLLGLHPYYQNIAKGAVIILAVAIEGFVHRRAVTRTPLTPRWQIRKATAWKYQLLRSTLTAESCVAVDKTELRSFCGVPYAAAPIGSHRFKAPRPAPPWTGVRDAIEPGPVCPQTPSRLRFAMGDFVGRQDEDCLHVTIWTPKADSVRRPVLVWLHGGAYMSGAGAIDWYSGERLAREGDIVVVGVNYRVGALGFLYRPGWSTGNLGLLDQQAALEWVRDNIAAFGGDPGNITLWGQSAGAQSITFLLARPQTRGLFRRAILQSPPFGSLPRSQEAAIATAEKFAHALGFDLSAATEQKLSQAPLDALFAAQAAAGAQAAKDTQRGSLPSPPFWPVGDGVVVPALEQYAAAMADAAQHTDVMIGTTREEMGVFFANNPAVQGLKKAPIPASDGERLKARRPAATAIQLFSDHSTEQIFRNGSVQWAIDATNARRHTYLYEFDWPSPDRKLEFVSLSRSAVCLRYARSLRTCADAQWRRQPRHRRVVGGDAGELDCIYP